MPYKCEECDFIGVKINHIIEKRLCKECLLSNKYKLICKSEIKKKYKFNDNDFLNYTYKEIYVNNPYYRNAPGMTLYYEKDIKRYFLNKHNDIIINKLNLDNINFVNINIDDMNNEDINTILEQLLDYFENIKNNNKKIKFDKILKKYDIEKEYLPNQFINNILHIEPIKDMDKIIQNFLREEDLSKILKQHKLEEYIHLKICTDFIEGRLNVKSYEIKDKINMMLIKKEQIKKLIKDNNLPKKKFIYFYNNFINSDNNDIDKLLLFIKNNINTLDKENII
jgi:hypothetical protein